MGMSFSVPEALVPAAPEGALMERFAEEASLQTPMDPLQRLDQSMEQTSDWVRLREILERSSPFVRNTICNALQYEMARSFQNVAQQLQAVQDIVAEMQRIMDSEEAVALGHLMRDIHPSNIRALQREADGIEEDITALRSALERGDFQSLQLRASRVGNKVRRFRDKYAELRPKLERLKSAVEKIADMCAAEARQSEDLITETEQKKESWWRLLENATNVVALVSGIAVFGSAGCLVVSVYAKSQALNVATAALASAKTAAAKAAATASDASAKATALTAAKATAAAEAKAAAAAAAEAAAAAAPTAAATAAAPAAGAEGAVAIGAGVAASGAAGAIGLGAPAATFLGSELLGSWAVSMGLMATPAAPLGAVLGVGAAVAAGVELMWSTAATATTVSATTAATSSAATSAAATTAAASTAAAKAASAASAAAAAAVQAATTAAANSVQAASAVTAAQTTVTSIQAAQAALWTSSRACFLYAGSLLLALALLGYVGRDLVKKLLGQLWAAEIEEHKRSKDAFQHMEQVVRLAAAKLGPVCAKNEALENCLDLVVEAAEELTAGAEDALVSTSHDMEHDRLHTLVEHLSSVYAQVPAAFAELSSSLRDLEPSLQHVGQIALHPAAAFDDRGESRLALSYAGHDADPTQGQSLDIEVDPHPQPENHLPENVFNMEVDQGWVLIQSPPIPSASDRLPGNTYVLVPVEEAVRPGVLCAAGPNGNHVIQVENQGRSPRLLRSFRFAGSPVQQSGTDALDALDAMD